MPTSVLSLRQMLAMTVAFALPLVGWYLTLAYAFGRFALLWLMPLSLVTCVGLSTFAMSRLLPSSGDDRRMIALAGYVIVLLLIMLGMIFLFEWDDALRWRR